MGDDKFHDEHPNGHTLVARDNPANRILFPDGTFGYVDIVGNSCSEDGQCPHYQYQDDLGEDQALETPIHMLVAAFRDKLCARTLHNAFSRAANPKRIFIRVIDQTQPDSDLVDDEGCWPRYCSEYNENCAEYKSQVRAVRVDSALSKGPTWARAKLSAMAYWDYMHRDEPEELSLGPIQLQDFCMQIDSHMDFSDNYDQGLIAMHHRTQNDYAVLSTYVADIVQNNKDPAVVPSLCMVSFTSSIRNWATKECRGLQKPKLTNAMWGAGLSFHRCHGEINVPVDPYLDNVFDGEEGSRGIRFFTNGYDVYTPDKVLVTHDYHGHQSNPVVHTWGGRHRPQGNAGAASGKGIVWEDSWKWMADIEAHRNEWHNFGTKRVNMLLSIGSYFNATKQEADEVELIRRSRFGVGTKRTLEQAGAFTGINLLKRRMEENKCGNLNWVPYDESPNFGIDETLVRGYGGEVVILNGQQPVVAGAVSRNVDSSANRKLRYPVLNGTSPTTLGNGQEAGLDYRVAGGLLLAVLAVARLTADKFRRKDQRYHD